MQNIVKTRVPYCYVPSQGLNVFEATVFLNINHLQDFESGFKSSIGIHIHINLNLTSNSNINSKGPSWVPSNLFEEFDLGVIVTKIDLPDRFQYYYSLNFIQLFKHWIEIMWLRTHPLGMMLITRRHQNELFSSKDQKGSVVWCLCKKLLRTCTTIWRLRSLQKTNE